MPSAAFAEIAFTVNERQENIGARRLHTVMERLLEDVSYTADSLTGETVHIDAAFVDDKPGHRPRRKPFAVHP